MILKRARDDLGGRGGGAVDQHDHREAHPGAAAVGHLAIHFFAALAHGAHDEAVGDESVRHLHALVEQPARVVAHVEDDALDAAGLRALFFDVFQTFQDPGVGDGGNTRSLM